MDVRKILILEDSQERIHQFQKRLPKDDLYFFDSVDEAKEAYNLLGPFDVIFLDHDLDGSVFVDSDEKNTGYQFAKFLVEKETEAQIIVHSMNSVGAQNIKNALPQAEIVPFPQLIRIIL